MTRDHQTNGCDHSIKTQSIKTQSTSWTILSIACALQLALYFIFIFWLKTPGLVNNLTSLLLIGAFLYLCGGLTRFDLGLYDLKRRAREAVTTTVTIWILLQIGLLVALFLQHGQVAFHAKTSSAPGLGKLFLGFVEQVVGNAFFEEFFFRGLLLSQVYLKSKESLRMNSAVLMFIAMVTTQTYFAVTHVPIRLANGMEGTALVLNICRVFFWGLLFAAIYLRTRNLLLAIGIHALSNDPIILFANVGYGMFSGILVLLIVALVAFWQWLPNRKTSESSPFQSD